MSQGTVRFELHDYDALLLVVTAVKDHFSGQGESWISVAALRAFADDLSAYPIHKASLELHSSCVEVSVEPADGVGHLRVRVRLLDGEGKFAMNSTIYLAAEFSQIARFADQIRLMASGEISVIEFRELP